VEELKFSYLAQHEQIHIITEVQMTEKEKSIEQIIADIEKIPIGVLDLKKYRKSIRKRFNNYRKRCRFFLFKEYDEKYCISIKNICDILFKTLKNPNTFMVGNHHFLFSLIESHMDFLKDVEQRCGNLDKDSLYLLYETILQKNEELKNVLISNLDKPVTKDQLINWIKQKEETGKPKC